MCCNRRQYLHLCLCQVANNFHIEHCQRRLDYDLDEYRGRLAHDVRCAHQFACVAERERHFSSIRNYPIGDDQPAVAHECGWRALRVVDNRACRIHGSSRVLEKAASIDVAQQGQEVDVDPAGPWGRHWPIMPALARNDTQAGGHRATEAKTWPPSPQRHV